MACSSTCPTQDHASFGECMRNKGIRVAYCNSAGGHDYSKQKQWDKDLDAYADARRQGIQPASTDRSSVDEAVKLSNDYGVAAQA